MRRKYGYPDKKELETALLSTTTLSAALRKLGRKPIGSNFRTIRIAAARFGISLDHMLGRGFNKDKVFKQLGELKKPESIKKRLISLRGYNCEICDLSEWQNKKLTLELDHIDGDPTNNLETNLRLLCPNCHSQTSNFRRRKS